MITRRMAILFSTLLLMGCGGTGDEAKKSPKPAKVEMLPQETELARITLTPKAEERLGIRTAPMRRESAKRYREVHGEVVVPAGKSILVSAPIPGRLTRSEKSKAILPGSAVRKGQELFTIEPLLSPERFVPTPAEQATIAGAKATIASLQLIAEGDVARGIAQVEGAQIALERAEQLLKDKAGSARDRDDALAALTIAQRTLEASKQRHDMLAKLTIDPSQGKATPLEVPAPRAGLLSKVFVAEGQTVSLGATLFEVIDPSTVWIRAPIYVGDQDRLDLTADARVHGLSQEGKDQPRNAKPIQAPPTADPIAVTTDLYYDLNNEDGLLRPGERVRVSIPMKGEAESLVIPWSAILFDIHGNAWVYEQAGPQMYQRRRVQVRYVKDELAILASGPEVSTPIVVEGAAELFGTELGAGK